MGVDRVRVVLPDKARSTDWSADQRPWRRCRPPLLAPRKVRSEVGLHAAQGRLGSQPSHPSPGCRVSLWWLAPGMFGGGDRVYGGMGIAVVALAYGGPEVLMVVEQQLAPPGPGEVLVDIRAAGADPADHEMYSGAVGLDQAKLPIRLGFEAAGVVAAVGDDAHGPAGPVEAGDEVFADRVLGGQASPIVVPAFAVLPKPSTLSFDQASGLMLTGATALRALTATSVGEGVRITGPAANVDAAIDTVGTDEAIDTSVALVADRGRIATIADFQ